MFGFLWLQKPSAEEIEQQRKEAAEMQAARDAQATDQTDVLTPDSVSPQEIATIKETVKQFGTVV